MECSNRRFCDFLCEIEILLPNGRKAATNDFLEVTGRKWKNDKYNVNLNIHQFESSRDSGTYKCVQKISHKNKANETFTIEKTVKIVEHFHLNVSTSDLVVHATSENSSTTAVISIDYDAFPPPRFEWKEAFEGYRNGRVILTFDGESNNTDENYQANYSRNNFALKISSLTTGTMGHCRNHTMSVSNLAGKHDVSVELIVSGE